MDQSEEVPGNVAFFKFDRYFMFAWIAASLIVSSITWNIPGFMEFWYAGTESFVGFLLFGSVRLVVDVLLALWPAKLLRRRFAK